MDTKEYKESVKTYTDAELKEQYETVSEEENLSWDNATYCEGEEKDFYLDAYNECKEQLEVLSAEIERRGIDY